MTVQAQSEIDRLFTSAREGSSSCLGRLLTLYTNYLKLLVAAQLDNRLRGRVSPSDIVQDTFFEAHRDFDQFRGQSTGEFVAWLRRIVVNNILQGRRAARAGRKAGRAARGFAGRDRPAAGAIDRPAGNAAGRGDRFAQRLRRRSASMRFCWPTRWPSCRPTIAT